MTQINTTMRMQNKTLPRTMKKLAVAIGAGLLATAVLASMPASVFGQAAPAAATQPTTRPTNRLVADGVGPDGKVRMMVNKTTVLATTKPFKQVSVGQTDIADVNLISP